MAPNLTANAHSIISEHNLCHFQFKKWTKETRVRSRGPKEKMSEEKSPPPVACSWSPNCSHHVMIYVPSASYFTKLWGLCWQPSSVWWNIYRLSWGRQHQGEWSLCVSVCLPWFTVRSVPVSRQSGLVLRERHTSAPIHHSDRGSWWEAGQPPAASLGLLTHETRTQYYCPASDQHWCRGVLSISPGFTVCLGLQLHYCTCSAVN